MQIVGFNFTKISGEKLKSVSKPPVTNIKFIDFSKTDLEVLKDVETVKISFSYNLAYSPKDIKDSNEKQENDKEKEGDVSLLGDILCSVTNEELKKMQKSWKKEIIPEEFKVPLFNLILRRCTPKAVSLQDELALPFHVPMPRVTGRKKQE